MRLFIAAFCVIVIGGMLSLIPSHAAAPVADLHPGSIVAIPLIVALWGSWDKAEPLVSPVFVA